MSLEGLTAVVTGAASGIGRASALRLAADGADVGVLDRDRDGLAETAGLVAEQDRRGTAVVVDLIDRDAVAAAFATVRRELGPVAILVNNAGGSGGDVRRFRNSLDAQWDQTVALNLRAARDCSREVINDMIEAGFGRIINTSSEQAFRGGPGYTDYAAAKAGLLGFTRSLAIEVGAHGVTVNAVCPGVTRTGLTDAIADKHLARAIAEIPVGYMAEPDDIAHAVSFFASREARYVTGEHLLVTGGRTMR